VKVRRLQRDRTVGSVRFWCTLVGVCAIAAIASRAVADVASDQPAAIVVFPKIIVDTNSGLDTLIRLSNTSNSQINAHCFYVNATPLCSVPGGSCFPDEIGCVGMVDAVPVFGTCNPQWQETDFLVRLTAYQPTSWLVSQGAVDCQSLQVLGAGVCSNNPNQVCQNNTECGTGNRCVYPPCFPLDGFFRNGPSGQNNAGSNVPPSAEDPFVGEMKCIALDESLAPVARNDLKGEALIGRVDLSSDFVDIAGYNGIGIPAIDGANNRDTTLVLGGAGDASDPNDPCHAANNCPEYEGCPNFLILNHFFDGAVDPVVSNVCADDLCTVSHTACASDADCQNRCVANSCTISTETCDTDRDCDPLVDHARVATDLTLIPCTEDFVNQNPGLSQTTAQFLVFNEFEQRFSTSRPVNCFKESRLSNLDTATNDRSIFSAGVAGSLTGQTRIRGVVPPDAEQGGPAGNALLGIAEEFRCRGPGFPLCSFTDTTDLISSTAMNLHIQGRRPQSDYIYLP
jgi:hypothetical protein